MSVVISNSLAANVIRQIDETVKNLEKGNDFRAGYELGRLYEAFGNAMNSQNKEEKSE
jgi:hypothetical protein